MVADVETIRPLGTRHSFSLVADSAGALLSTENLNRVVEIGDQTVTVEPGIRYGDLSSALESHGLALPNLASLPHISVGGAIATGTHGSGARNPSLAAGIASLELVCPDGSISRLQRGDEDFEGAVVSLGAIGLVTSASLDVVPSFELRQYVFEGLPWSTLETDLDAILEGGYSVSLFTLWSESAIGQVWVKTTERLDSQSSFFGARAAKQPRHPIAGASSENCTEQLGVPGPSGERLPHFRLGFTPSSGAELQSEYVIARKHGADAVRELRRLGRAVSPLLLTSEIRSIAADTLWLSPFYEQDSIAHPLHVEAATRSGSHPLAPDRERARAFRPETALGEAVRSVGARPRSRIPEAAGLSAAPAEARSRRQVPQRVRCPVCLGRS